MHTPPNNAHSVRAYARVPPSIPVALATRQKALFKRHAVAVARQRVRACGGGGVGGGGALWQRVRGGIRHQRHYYVNAVEPPAYAPKQAYMAKASSKSKGMCVCMWKGVWGTVKRM